ncbi:MAG: precorrin-6A reductase [Lachnospiraceae bacterium]|nr:precorrin-6A reductase [Robinsoniella sp.]MDY3767315.1 precorrin-6A reductase [Lachnospiraceae bacterium]
MNILIFAGTTEGRNLAQYLGRQKISCHVCVATEYGEQLIEENSYIRVHTGRLTSDEMEELMRQQAIDCVVDATHPYAVIVSQNIKKACEEISVFYQRLLRSSVRIAQEEDVIFVDSVEEAARFLNTVNGNVLITTGSKELSKFTGIDGYEKRLYARVLSTPEVARACADLGFVGSHLICMQGPFSEELNVAMMRQIDAAYLVTKESGKAGGFEEKIRAARKAGAKAVIIGRPSEEEGMSLDQVKAWIMEREQRKVRHHVAFVGIGMGDRRNMTIEAMDAVKASDVLIGAKRMLQTFSYLEKPVFCEYRAEEIAKYIEDHPEYENVAILLSGDVGFYSGAKKLLSLLGEEEIDTYPGISSVVAFCARMQTAWDDVKLMSLHGRGQNVIHALREYGKVFALIGTKQGVSELCRKLNDYGMGDTKVSVGESLSYPTERIVRAKAADLIDAEFETLTVVLLERKKEDVVVTHGISDEEFVRDKVPMTKEEIRSISLSKLRLKKDSVVYDIGAGTGSVSIEMALQASEGMVYAIEKKKEAVDLILENKRKFAADNLEVIEGMAPGALRELPVPTHAFIGGSSGNMREILGLLLEKNREIRIVVNAIAVETVAETLECLKELPFCDEEIVQVSVGRSKKVASYHMMMGLNPVFIFSFSGGEKK